MPTDYPQVRLVGGECGIDLIERADLAVAVGRQHLVHRPQWRPSSVRAILGRVDQRRRYPVAA